MDSAEARAANALSSDPRVRRTRRLLLDAALALVAEREIGEITITDITRAAGVNRATFYQHYLDKQDLIAQALDDLFDEITTDDRAFLEAGTPPSFAAMMPPLALFFQRLDERGELFRRLLGNTGTTAFSQRLVRFYEAAFAEQWAKVHSDHHPDEPPLGLRARAAAAEGQAVIAWWLEHGRQEPVTQMAAWMAQFCCEALGIPASAPAVDTGERVVAVAPQSQ